MKSPVGETREVSPIYEIGIPSLETPWAEIDRDGSTSEVIPEDSNQKWLGNRNSKIIIEFNFKSQSKMTGKLKINQKNKKNKK